MSTPRNKRKSAARESFHGSDGILVLRATRTQGQRTAAWFTVEDDGVFTRPWSAAVSYRRQGEWPEMVSFALDVNAAKQAEERGQRESFHGSEGSWSCAQPGHKGNGLQLEFTVEDDGVFTKPWSAARELSAPRRGMVCAENVITHPYRTDQAAVRSGTGAARASRMAARAVRPARRPVATMEQRSA
jgi:hypothetical protein